MLIDLGGVSFRGKSQEALRRGEGYISIMFCLKNLKNHNLYACPPALVTPILVLPHTMSLFMLPSTVLTMSLGC